MANSDSSLTNLFRSLKADDQAIPPSQETGSEPRWPLLKSSPPTKWSVLPKLSEQEKQQRRHGQGADPIEGNSSGSSPFEHKAILSVPGVNGQLAAGLRRLVSHKPSIKAGSSYEPVQVKARASTLPPDHSVGSSSLAQANLGLPSALSALPSSKPVVAPSVANTRQYDPLPITNTPSPTSRFETQSSMLGKLVKSVSAEAPPVSAPSLQGTGPSASIKSLLQRIEQAQAPAQVPAATPSAPRVPAFLARLGKR